MGRSRTWDIAIVSTVAVLVVLLLVNGESGWELAGGTAAAVAVAVVWFALARRQRDGGPLATTAVALVIVIAGVGCAISPSIATIQVIAFPLAWTLLPRTRHAVIANVLLATSVAVGYFFGRGATLASLAEATIIEVISLAGSLALGFWITRISEVSHERELLLDELRDTQARLADVSRDAGAAGERERLAREIHDTIAQDLTGIVLLAQRTRRELVDGNPTVGETLDLLEQSARGALAETRALVAAAASVDLDHGGVAEALVRLAERFDRETDMTVTVRVGELPPLGRDTEVVLLRCAQEGLANVRKHSGASSAALDLDHAHGVARLLVRDDGSGFDTAAPRDGFGLSGMRDRLALVGGTLGVESGPGAGTRLTVSLPVMALAAASLPARPAVDA